MPNPDATSAAVSQWDVFSKRDLDCAFETDLPTDGGAFTKLLHRLAAEHAREVGHLRAQLALLRSDSPTLPKTNGLVDTYSNGHTRKQSSAPLPLPVVMHETDDTPDHGRNDTMTFAKNPSTSATDRRLSDTSAAGFSSEGRTQVSIIQTAEMAEQYSMEEQVSETNTKQIPLRPFGSESIRTGSHFQGCVSASTNATRASRVEEKVDQILSSTSGFRSSSILLLGHDDDSPLMETFVSFIIVLNIIQMGISSDASPKWQGWIVIDGTFAVFFLAELLVKLKLHGFREHFFGKLRFWNGFDFLIVVMAFIDFGVAVRIKNDETEEEGGGFNMSLLRTVRLLRLARLTRLLRGPIFKELNTMFLGFVYGTRTLFWSFVLVITPLYPVAIILRETVGNSAGSPEMKKDFDSVTSSWFTIFRCVMGDCSDENGRPIFLQVARRESWLYASFYIIVVITTVFGLFNVVTAIYVENIVAASKHKELGSRRKRLQDHTLKANLTQKLVQLFTTQAVKAQMESPKQQASELRSVLITEDMFEDAMQDDKVQLLLDRLDIADEDRVDLFEILDADGSGGLEVSELVNGILKLRGGARRSDVVSCRLLLHDLQDSVRQLEDRSASIMQRLIMMTRALHYPEDCSPGEGE